TFFLTPLNLSRTRLGHERPIAGSKEKAMPVEISTSTLPDVTPIHRLIRTTRHLLRSTWVITGAALTAGFFLSALFAATLLDLLAPLGVVLRCIALAIVVVPAAWAFAAGVLRPLFRRLSSGQVARRIEAHLPGIHNR